MLASLQFPPLRQSICGDARTDPRDADPRDARAYRTFIERHAKLEITPVSCLTHITRKFKEARDEHPRIAAPILLLTGSTYQVEKRLREENATPLDRQRTRWLESRKPYDHLAKLIRRLARFRRITPRSKLDHKNWMFIGGEHTGWRSAVIHTFVEQVRRHGADPFGYFEWVSEKLMLHPAPEELQALLPANWIKTRPAASQTIESRVA